MITAHFQLKLDNLPKLVKFVEACEHMMFGMMDDKLIDLLHTSN